MQPIPLTVHLVLYLLADRSTLVGTQAWATIIDWKAWKLKQVTRSSPAGEVHAFGDAHDYQEWLRASLLEIREC